jgi:hypothetical protein
VKLGVLNLTCVKPEILHKTEAEAVFGIGAVRDFYITAFGHHHSQIFFELLRGEINGGIGCDFVYKQHKKISFNLLLSAD